MQDNKLLSDEQKELAKELASDLSAFTRNLPFDDMPRALQDKFVCDAMHLVSKGWTKAPKDCFKSVMGDE